MDPDQPPERIAPGEAEKASPGKPPSAAAKVWVLLVLVAVLPFVVGFVLQIPSDAFQLGETAWDEIKEWWEGW